MEQIRDNFKMYQTHKDLVYLDNAASTLTPTVVTEAMDVYYNEYRSNVHRGLYPVSAQATERYEQARATIAEFFHADTNEIIFTSGVTQGLNVLAYSLTVNLKKGDSVVISQLEHHANIIPWQQAATRHGFELRYIEIDTQGNIKKESIDSVIDSSTKIVSCSMMSNAIGTMLPINEILTKAKSVGAVTVLDAAQVVAHQEVDVTQLGCDFLVCSGHKLYGPTGIGILYGRYELLKELEPATFGGEMIEAVTYESATWAEPPQKFEAGTPNIAGAIGLATATVYLQHLRWEDIQAHEVDLKKYALSKLREEVKIIGPDLASERGGVISFIIPDIHPHDCAEILARYNICARAGHHCAMPLIKQLGLSGTVRISLGIYNTRDDIDRLIEGIHQVKKVFST